jgi:glyoxylase-like metal-dependent hydrolase (beta-lactamase superfamily II)
VLATTSRDLPAFRFWNMMNSDRYQRGLAGTGLGVGEIDFVMCTHLHVDHVGWNTRLENGRWVPTFPNARYVLADRDLHIGRSATKTIRQHVPGLLIPCCRSWRLTASTS